MQFLRGLHDPGKEIQANKLCASSLEASWAFEVSLGWRRIMVSFNLVCKRMEKILQAWSAYLVHLTSAVWSTHMWLKRTIL